MISHRKGQPVPRDVLWVLDRIIWILATCNGLVGLALIVGSPGASPALLFLRLWGIPLPIWGCAYLAVAALILFDQRVVAHAVAVTLWSVFAAGAIYGLLTGATTSPAASMILAVVVVTIGGIHVIGFLFRRKVKRHL